jgi:radical SAM protein with 4Fe4S-binding SPASM domain
MNTVTQKGITGTDGCVDALPEFFQFVEIEINTACNLRCRYCPNSISDRGLIKNNRKMPTALFHRLIDELSAIGFAGEFHPHLYNEPLLDDRLFDLLQYVRQKLESCKIALFTNGQLLTLEKYLQLVTCGVDSICVTRHQRADPPHIATILQHREKHGDDNVRLDYIREGLNGEVLFNRGGAIPLKEVLNITRRCTWPAFYLTINFKGDVLLCCNDYYSTFPIGNVTNNTIMEVWNKPYNKSLREYLSKDVSKVSLCRKCMIGIVQ